ncbi:MAG: hypothetical protein GEU78_07855 [Actinobacteria bacterium]|nr:hypothetical protein [Actinomycetota bacterium]
MADAVGAPLPIDTGFTRTLAGRTEAALSLTDRPSSGLRSFDADDFDADSDVPVFSSVSAAFANSGVVTGLARAAARRKASLPPDPDYDIEADLTSRPDDLKLVQDFLDRPDDPDSSAVLSLLADSQSAHETAQIITNLRDAQERQRIAQANGFVPELVGMIGGIGIDIMALWGTTALTGGAGLFGTLGVRGAFAARAASAGRLGAFGAVEGFAERRAQQLTNPLISDRDLFEAAGFGAGAGAFLGFVSPTLLGNVRRIADDIDNLKPHAAAVESAIASRGPRSVGAAGAVEAATVNVPGKGAGSLVSGKVIPQAAQESVLRSPKRVMTDIGVKGNKDFIEKGLEGGRKWFDTMSRVVRLSTVMADEVGGGVARAPAVDDLRSVFRAKRLARQETATADYAAMMKDVFGVGGVRRALRNNALHSFEKRLISQEQYEAMADEYAMALAQGHLDAVDIIPTDIGNRLTPDQRSTLIDRLKKTAADEDAYYQEFGAAELKHGLIKEEDLIPGYRPQRWNREEIAKDPMGFQQYLTEVFEKQPDEDWIRTNYGLRKEDGTFEPAMKDGETWDAFSKRDPEAANDILEDWSAAVREDAANTQAVIARAKDRELTRLRGKSLMEIEQRVQKNLEGARRSAQKIEAQLESLRRPNAPESAQQARPILATRLGKIEKRIADEEGKLEVLRTLEAADRSLSGTFPIAMGRSVSGDAADAAIRRLGNAGQKKALNKIERVARRAAQKEVQIAGRRLVTEQIESIKRAILDNDSPFDFIDPEFIQSSSRFKRRNIHLGRHRFRDESRRFLLTSTHDARTAFDSSVGTQVALREVFAPILEREGLDFSLENVRRVALQGFDDDLMKTASESGRSAINRERVRAKKIFDEILEEMTGADVTGLRNTKKSAQQLVSVLNTATAASSLGGLVLAQLGDLGVQIMAGGRLGTGFRMMWRRGVNKHIREIAKNEPELAVLIQGSGTLDAARFRAIADVDNRDFDIPGGKWRSVMRGTDAVAKIEGWANLANVWNIFWRGGFGLDMARQMDQDFARYVSLPPYLKSFYAKVGINADDARDMTDLMNRAHHSAVNGHLRYPHASKWAEERPDLLSKYQIAIDAAGKEAMIEPGIADRSFLRSFAGGRLLMQFQSFMFTAGERFIAPMIQEMQIHPTSIRPYFAALAGVFLGVMTDGLKETARGEGEAWLDRWESAEGWKENLWGGILRSPMMAGPSSMLTDVAMSTMGRVGNDRIQDVTGVRPLMESSSRFREQQGAFALAGPVIGTALGTLPAITRRYLDGDVSGATDMLSRRIPILNLFYLQMLARLAERD